MPVVPILNVDTADMIGILRDKLTNQKHQRRIIMVVVCTALLLDNMLYMVIVPIIPHYLKSIGRWYTPDMPLATANPFVNTTQNVLRNSSLTYTANNLVNNTPEPYFFNTYSAEDTGLLFASKAILQLCINPFSGAIIDRIGYDIPLMIGLLIIFLSTMIFAFGKSYAVLFFARALQGFGSAFADTSGLAMIADRFTEEGERTQALGIALAFISFGCLFAPPFGGVLYQFAGKEVPFIILALVALIDAGILSLVVGPIRQERKMKKEHHELPKGTPIWRLLLDPYIAITAGALAMSNVSLAFIEPTISNWMEDTLGSEEWQTGLVWLPAFFPHVFGVYLTVKLAKNYPKYQWLMALVGLALEGIMCLIIPFSGSFGVVIIPLMGICFGIALVDTALLPTLAHLVDVRHVSIYGSVYAIADISYSMAYAFGPIAAGSLVAAIGFIWLNVIICFTNVLYAPLLVFLRVIYKYTPLQNECDVLLDTPKDHEYQTYMVNSTSGTRMRPVDEEKINHLEYSSKSKEEPEGPQPQVDTNDSNQRPDTPPILKHNRKDMEAVNPFYDPDKFTTKRVVGHGGKGRNGSETGSSDGSEW